MMIEIKKFSKRFGERIIYDNISLSLPQNGVVAIVGESGSGKTTLLNAIAGLDFDYDGEILIDSTNLKSLSPNDICDYRIHNIGYVFQNFNLLNLDNVKNNILLPFESISNSSKKVKERKVDELTNLLGISKLKKEPVNKLSGGEKQRVAIARAMINSPKVILCDEPTGALDESNSEQIYALLRKISRKSLILIASHDYEGVSKIADKIIKIEDGKIFSIQENKIEDDEEVNFLENNHEVDSGALPVGFKLRHSLQKLKSKKYRSLITNGMLSLSLSGIGIAIILATSVSKRIEEAFSSLTNGNQIVMSLKQESQNTFSNAYSAPLDRVEDIYNKYNYYLKGIGTNYLVNFEDFFKDQNDVYVSSTPYKISLPYYSTRSINDFKWLNDEQKILYPYSVPILEDDQVVLGLTYAQMVNLCFELKIQRNFTSLGHYIYENGLSITLEIRNNSWQYDDEQIFEVKAVTETNRPIFYHTNTLWNEKVFEEMMLLPSDDDGETFFPWEMHKIYYFKTIEDPQTFLDAIFFDEEFSDFIFERTNASYNPNLCLEGELCSENRVMIYLADKIAISPNDIKNLEEIEPNVKDYYFISEFGYASFASNLLSGFSKSLFVSCDETKILMAVDADSEIQDSTVQIDLPDDVAQGNFLNGISGGLRFSSKFDKLSEGRKPSNNHEIVISKGLASKIDPQGVGLGKYLYIAGENNEYYSQEDKINKEYQVDKVVIVGITDEEKNYLYHDCLWTISFFRDRLGVSSFHLIPTSAVIELDDKVDASNLVSKLNSIFREYNFSSPVDEISKSVDSTLKYANAILIGFSTLATLISILLLGTVVLLNVLESKDEIFLLGVVGIKQKEINSLFVVQSLVQGLIAFILCAVELIVVDYVISLALGETLHTKIGYTFNYLPILIIFIFATILPYLTSLVLVKSLMFRKGKEVAKSKAN